MKEQNGFTLIELMLSVAVLGILTALSLPFYLSFQNRNELSLTMETVASMMRRAQTYARGVNADSEWSVSIQPGSAIIFRGNSFVARDIAYDETVVLTDGIVPSGLSQVTFSKLQATPNTTGSITLTSPNTNDTRMITINAKGMVSY